MNDEIGKPENEAGAPIEKPEQWKMPEPVFRTSEGEKYCRAEIEEDLHETQEPLPPSQGKSSNIPFLLGGAFVVFVVATAFVAGIWFLFLRNIEPPKVLTPDVPKETANAEASLALPGEIEYKTAMVLVPAGEFTMGGDTGDDVSKPAHKVELSAFYIDKFEVTNAQYKEFCDAMGRAYPSDQYWDEDYFSSRPDAPVLGVSFADAQAFAAWAGKRLPTEEEWEKAASWDDVRLEKREFPWGGNFGSGNVAFDVQTSTDVGKYPSGASFCGAMDMAGNAFEWVDSYFLPYPGNTTENEEFGEGNRVIRGGYFGSKTNDRLKTTKRVYVPPDFVSTKERASYVGFRCAISADDPRLKAERGF